MYTNQHTRTLERYLFVPLHVGSFSTSLSLSLPSVCSQCQPVISPCKVSVVRSPCVWILLSSQTLGKRGGGANSLCFICQVCCCYATHFRVKVKSQEMQPECCDFIYQLNRFVCLSARAAAQKWWERWCNLFIFFHLRVFLDANSLVFEHLVHVECLFIYYSSTKALNIPGACGFMTT